MMYQVSYEMDQLIGVTDDGYINDNSEDDDNHGDGNDNSCNDHTDEDCSIAVDISSSASHDFKTDTCQKKAFLKESFPDIASCPDV